MFYFHSGGAVMGSDHRYVLKEDGTTQKIQNSYHETTLIGDKLYMYWIGPTPGPGNLRVQNSGDIEDDNSKSLGATDYWYYSLCDINGLPKFKLKGNELYVRASKVLQNYDDNGSRILEYPAVYKVNKYIFRRNDKCKPSERKGVGEHVYYVNEGTLYHLSGNESLNPKAEALSISITGDNREYLACTFSETPNSKYRVMVFDKSGSIVFKTSDSGSNVIVEGNILYFYNITTETLCKTILR